MPTKTGRPKAPAGYDSSGYPPFAVTVDVVVLTVAAGQFQVLLVRRGVPPFEGTWAIPGGFKRPAETDPSQWWRGTEQWIPHGGWLFAALAHRQPVARPE